MPQGQSDKCELTVSNAAKMVTQSIARDEHRQTACLPVCLCWDWVDSARCFLHCD